MGIRSAAYVAITLFCSVSVKPFHYDI